MYETMSCEDWPLLLYTIYCPLLILINLIELAAIFKHRKTTFSSSFYSIFSMLAVVNIAACLLVWFVYRLPLSPLANRLYDEMTGYSVWLTASYSNISSTTPTSHPTLRGAYYLNCLSEFLHVVLASNRFTAIYFPVRHDQIWRRTMLLSIAVCLVLSLAPVVHLFNNDTNFNMIFVETYTIFFLYSADNTGEEPIWLNMVIVTVVCNSVSFLLYGACLIRLCATSQTRNHTAERNLFLVGFLTMIVSLPYMSAMIVFYVNFSGAGNDYFAIIFAFFQMPWLTDLKYLTPAPMLLITNQSIRRVIMKMFWKGSAFTPVATVSVIITQTKRIDASSKP